MDDLEKEQKRDIRTAKALVCTRSHSGNHQWIITSSSKTNTATHASELLCGHCFHRVNIQQTCEDIESSSL